MARKKTAVDYIITAFDEKLLTVDVTFPNEAEGSWARVQLTPDIKGPKDLDALVATYAPAVEDIEKANGTKSRDLSFINTLMEQPRTAKRRSAAPAEEPPLPTPPPVAQPSVDPLGDTLDINDPLHAPLVGLIRAVIADEKNAGNA